MNCCAGHKVTMPPDSSPPPPDLAPLGSTLLVHPRALTAQQGSVPE